MTKTGWNNFKRMLKATGTYFETIGENEIAIPMPCDKLIKDSPIIPQKETIKKLNTGECGVVSDEIYIHVEYDQRTQDLYWLAVIGELPWL